MNHNRVDRIMEQVAQYYRGDFSINNDDDLSRKIAQRLSRRNERVFHGLSKTFGVGQMSCTDVCVKGADTISVPKDGVVFGPYYTFEQGTYFAAFYLSGEQMDCQLQVASQNTGIIAAAMTGELEQRPGNMYVIAFSLLAKTENLEFKVVNCGSNTVVFEKVCISIKEPIVAATAEQENTVVQLDLPRDESSAEIMELLEGGQSDLVRSVRELSKAAVCALPQNTRHRRIKQIIRKIINCFVVFQVMFNNGVTDLCRSVVRKLSHMTEALAVMLDRQNQQEEQTTRLITQQETISLKLQEMEQKLVALEGKQMQQIATADAKESKYRVALERHGAQLEQHKEQLEQQEERFVHLSESLIAMGDMVRQWSENGKQLEEAFAQHCVQIQEPPNVHEEDFVRLSNGIGEIWEKIKEIDKEFTAIWGQERGVNADLANLWKTYSTMRQELFYEIESRVKVVTSGQGQSVVVNTQIKSSAREKVVAAGGKIRLNLGSGSLTKEGYLSVDARDLNGVDVVADVGELPYEMGSVDEIYSAHLIEHFTKQKLEKELLPYWYSLLKPDGKLTVIFPDMEAMLESYHQGNMSFDQLGYLIMGAQDYQLDYHYAVYSPDIVVAMLKAVGLRDIQIVARGRENGGCLETEIRAVK